MYHGTRVLASFLCGGAEGARLFWLDCGLQLLRKKFNLFHKDQRREAKKV